MHALRIIEVMHALQIIVAVLFVLFSFKMVSLINNLKI